MKGLLIVLAVAAMALGSGSATAQNRPPEMARIRLRTTTPDNGTPSRGWVLGHLERIGADTLWLRVGRPDGPLAAIDRGAIRQMEMSNGRRRHPGKGALWGAGAGLGLGLLAVAALDDCAVTTRGWSFDICRGNEDFVLLGSVAAGAAWGTVVGLLITSERWVTMPAASLAAAAATGRVGVALRIPLPR